jgi:hypothetical protein
MIINGKFSDINIMFEEFKTQCPWLNNINEGCLSSEFFMAYYSYSKDEEFYQTWKKWEEETRLIDSLRRQGKTKKKPCTGYFGMLVEWALKGEKGDTKRETDLEEGDIKSLPLIKRKMELMPLKKNQHLLKWVGLMVYLM